MPTDIGFTGQRLDATGLSYFHARYYSGVLGRFVSADSIMPGAADGSGGGAMTLGYDKSTRLTPLATDFHECLSQVTGENQAVLQHGPFFQWDDKVRKDHPVPMGPMNPQSLNRYAYVYNNPINNTDPTGHRATNCEYDGDNGHCGQAPSKPQSTVLGATNSGQLNGDDWKNDSSSDAPREGTLRSGGKYNNGQLYAQGAWRNLYVPPSGLGWNTPYMGDWQELAHQTGLTYLPPQFGDGLTGFVGDTNSGGVPPENLGGSYYQKLQMGPTDAQYFGPNKFASEPDPSDPSNLSEPGIGLLKNLTGLSSGVLLINGLVGSGNDIELRGYYMSFQFNPKQFSDRVVISMYHIYDDNHGLHVSGNYLSVIQTGFHETPMRYHPGEGVYTNPCYGSTFCP